LYVFIAGRKIIMKLPTIQKYEKINVVRDDVPFPFPSPNFSKIRGLELKMKQLEKEGIKDIAVQDTIMSRCGWGASYLAEQYGIKCYNFYSRRKNGIDFYRKMSESFGATTIPLMGTHQRIARQFAEQWLKKKGIKDYYFLPIGLSMPETIEEHIKLVDELPRYLFEGSLVVCVSSGTILSGLLAGIIKKGYHPEVYGVQAHSWKNREDAIGKKIGLSIKTKSLFGEYSQLVDWQVVDMGYEYLDFVKEAPPFPCDRYLDRKAWSYVLKFSESLKAPITFWNIGGEWNPDIGIGDGLRGDGFVTEEQIKDWLNRK
jgi:1-aminocyclopropane-1-carboxylate deaminase/D-cysteine desulfhydrase-like pyridoxal-dependent ACC family enzyme